MGFIFGEVFFLVENRYLLAYDLKLILDVRIFMGLYIAFYIFFKARHSICEVNLSF